MKNRSYKLRLAGLLDELPDNVSDLDKYLGSAGFGNANNYTVRHSWVQAERLLENKQKLALADEIIFENPLSNVVNGQTVNSVSDIYLEILGEVYELETKAGMKFFQNMSNSNFVPQSFNSLKNVTKIENYKVFLNPSIKNSLNNTSKLNVINAWKNWENGAIFELPGIKEKFITFGNKYGFDFEMNTVEDFLIQNDEWFNLIFKSNL